MPLPELAHAWVAGWVLSRGTPPPVAEPWGLRIDVGLPDQVVRHVLPEADEVTVRKVAETVTAPYTWIKTFIEPELLAPWLGPDWTEDDPGWLMAVDLRRSATRRPDGYVLTSDTAGGVTRVRVLDPSGELAARGQAAVPGAVAVMDQIVTEPAHQRRGLGSLVMRTLQNAALDQGATGAVLGATVEGRALYESLGWAVHAPLAGFIHRPLAAATGVC